MSINEAFRQQRVEAWGHKMERRAAAAERRIKTLEAENQQLRDALASLRELDLDMVAPGTADMIIREALREDNQ